MGGSESKLEQEKRRQAADQIFQNLRLENQAFVQKWPQNARGFSGKPLAGMVYVAVIFDTDSIRNKPWLAFETRDEADRCLAKYHGSAYRNPSPFVYQQHGYITSHGDVSYLLTYWISVVSRKQAREEGLFCEDHEEEDANPVEGGIPESGATVTATAIPTPASAPII